MTSKIAIQNLKCGGCASTIISKITAVGGVTGVEVSTDDDTVTVDYDNETALHEAKSVLKAIGYPEVGEDNSLVSKAKSFVSCATGRIKS